MKKLFNPNLHVVLTHYPVMNKNGDTIASAVTNLDLHDIARAAKTYGARSFYVVTPLQDQKELIEKITEHWKTGAGSRYNPKRKEALALIRIKHSLEEVREDIALEEAGDPKTVITSARRDTRNIRFNEFRKFLENGDPYLLIFGTAWGLSGDVVQGADYLLEPIEGGTGYNHLSVRSAAAVILDRLMGRDTEKN